MGGLVYLVGFECRPEAPMYHMDIELNHCAKCVKFSEFIEYIHIHYLY